MRLAGRRHATRQPSQLVLAVLGVALGVAVVVSVDLAGASARRGFELSTRAVTGRVTHQIVGGSAGVPEALYVRLRSAGFRGLAPIVDGYVALAEATASDSPRRGRRRALRLIGVDFFAEGGFRSYLASPRAGLTAPSSGSIASTGGVGASDGVDGQGGTGRPESAVARVGGPSFDIAPLLVRPGTAMVSSALAAELGIAKGERIDLKVTSGGTNEQVEIVGLIEPADELSRQGLSDLLIADIATAQELLGQPGRLTRIDVIAVSESPDDSQRPPRAHGLRDLRASLPSSVRLVEAQARADATIEMTRAFRLNLAAMSLLALLCGMFLIFNTMTFSVLKRREVLGISRTLGVTGRQLFGLVLTEALAVGALGTVLGLAGGIILGRGLVGLVTQTVNDLYFVTSVRSLAIPGETLAKGAALGLLASAVAAAAPAWEASTTSPRSAQMRSHIEARARRWAPRVAVAGIVALALAVLLLTWRVTPADPMQPRGGTDLLLAFAGMFALVVGAALLAPIAVQAATLVSRQLPWGASGAGAVSRMAIRGVAASLSRTSMAIAALMVAVSVIIGVRVMVSSFRLTLQEWMTHTLSADFYVAPAASGPAGADLQLDADFRAQLEQLPGVVSTLTVRRAEVEGPGGPTLLMTFDLSRADFDAYRLVEGSRNAAWAGLLNGGVMISEPYAFRHRLAPGSVLGLLTEAGERDFVVAGVYTSFATDRGLVMMLRTSYEQHWSDRGISGISVTALPDVDLEVLGGLVRDLFNTRQAVNVQSNRALREASLEVFDRTFLITSVLRMLVTLVAFVGVLSALMAIQLERRRELGVLRAIGLTPGQVWGMASLQTTLMGLYAGLLALPLGLVLASLMIHVINRRSFGWTMQMQVPPEALWQALLLSIGAALLAGLYPAYRMGRQPPLAALREE